MEKGMSTVLVGIITLVLISGCISIGLKTGRENVCSNGQIVSDPSECERIEKTLKQSGREKETTTAYNVGENFVWENFSVTVDKAEYNYGVPPTTDLFGEIVEYKQPEGKVAVITITVENLDKKPRNFRFGFDRIITLVDEKGREFAAPLGYYGINCSWHAVYINPSMSRTDCVFFDIPKDSEDLKLKLHTTSKLAAGIYTGGEENILYVDLGI